MKAPPCTHTNPVPTSCGPSVDPSWDVTVPPVNHDVPDVDIWPTRGIFGGDQPCP